MPSKNVFRMCLLSFLLIALASIALIAPNTETKASATTRLSNHHGIGMYWRPAPDYDLNLSGNLGNTRQATGAQLAALDNLRAGSGANDLQARWNDFGGSIDVVMDFASAPQTGTPEEAARAFIAANAALFGVSSLDNLRVASEREALGGHLIRFQQTHGGIDVKNGGIGLVMNRDKQVIMASGPFFRDVSVNTTPTINASNARAAADADLAAFRVNIPAYIQDLLQPGLDILSRQAAVVEGLEPKLGIYPTADGYRLVWKVARFSTNPFGLYLISIDAHTGETVARKDYVNFQLPMTGDIYPKFPEITDELKNFGRISVGPDGTPLGQERVALRSFDASNVVTGLEGTLTGTHTVVHNALATKLPFLQAARGTWHFRVDDPVNFEARTNEQDHLAEPAEHQDEINAFFFVTYLLEYVDYLHVEGDRVNNSIGQGSFPDDYPNKTIPLPATVHLPNIIIALDALEGRLPDPTDPDIALKVLGLDNAFAFNLTSLIEALTGVKSPLVVNPTAYGHGFLFNDLALEATVPYHEGMHAITSPIAGLEGDPEGGALNEGQADMWAFTITDTPSLGEYVVNAFKLRERFRELGRDPDSIAYIRSARSTLKYSDIGTLNDGGQFVFEEHYDGEIYMSTMWDIREMLNRVYPSNTFFKRPLAKDGTPSKAITQGTEIFERIYLGSMYVLGTTSPDTMVKARDATIIADKMLYSSNTADPAAPGKHRALIENIFAAHELGVNAREVTAGAATISTQVTPFAGSQPAPSVPKKVTVAPASTNSLRIGWQGVKNAIAYQVLKRKIGFENQREPNGKRVFNDGDAATTGFRHVAYVSGNLVSYEDRGPVQEIFAPAGLADLFDHEYVVRAIGIAPNGQLGFSDLSGSARPVAEAKDVTAAIDTAISNVSFANGIFAFDQTLTNARGSGRSDQTIYDPIEFQIISISDSSVTVRNPDQATPVPTFFYNETLPLGATSQPRRLEFNDPLARLFTFDAKVIGQVYKRTAGGRGSQDGDGTSDPPQPITYSVFREERTGILPVGDPTGLTHGGGLVKEDHFADPNFKGITYMDVEIVTKSDALILDAKLSSTLAVDLDFELREADGSLITRSAGPNASERVQAEVQPGTRYILRVIGWINGPADFRIISDQLLPHGSPNENAGTVTIGTSDGGFDTLVTMRFTVNPLLRKVTMNLF